MTIAEAARALLAELEADDIPAPLTVRFTLATTLADLARLAGERLPPEVAAALDAPACALPSVSRRRETPRRVAVPRYAD